MRIIIVIAVCDFLIGGGNYVTAFLNVFCGGIILLYLLANKKARNRKKILIFLLFFFLAVTGLLISGLAPGNAVRQANYVQGGFMDMVCKTATDTVSYAWKYLRRIWFFPFVFLPVLIHPLRKFNYSIKTFAVIFIISWAAIFAQIFPPVYAMGAVNGGRLENIIFFSFVWLYFINFSYMVGLIISKAKIFQTNGGSRATVIKTAVCAVLFAVCLVVTRNDLSGNLARRELMWGIPQQVYAEYQERLTILKSDVKDVVLKPFSIYSQQLWTYETDITTDPDNWANVVVKNYYEKNYVILSE